MEEAGGKSERGRGQPWAAPAATGGGQGRQGAGRRGEVAAGRGRAREGAGRREAATAGRGRARGGAGQRRHRPRPSSGQRRPGRDGVAAGMERAGGEGGCGRRRRRGRGRPATGELGRRWGSEAGDGGARHGAASVRERERNLSI
nr:spidroin-1-like [Aegilops tauschii subsp. strangulata]